jgi:hypothetical protein
MAEERKVVKGTGEAKRKAAKKQEEKMETPVSIDSQARLAEILTDSPRLVSLNGTEWEVRALRMGTQWLIAKKAIEVNKADSATMGDILRQFAVNMPAVLDVITLALLNDRNKIYKNGRECEGLSDLYRQTRETLEWECNPTEFGELLFEILQMMSVDFFWNALDILAVFRASVTERKRTRIAEPK